MGKGSEQADFEREFRGQIERFAPSVVAALRAIITAKRPPAVKILASTTDLSRPSTARDFSTCYATIICKSLQPASAIGVSGAALNRN